jgi:ribonuclease Z
MERLEGLFITHFHSDHIAEIYEFNINSWVAGRPVPLVVYGPEGVEEVIDGLNASYRLDRSYRVNHHGAELLPPQLGVIQPALLQPGTSVDLDGLKVSSFIVNHDPVLPAVGYRFNYRGRSVVISGDAIVTPGLIEASRNADLLLQDALSLTIIDALVEANPDPRFRKVLVDIQDYHAHTSHLAELVDKSGVSQLALYHLVPAPQNALLEKIFLRDVPDGTTLTEDGMMFELPADSDEIIQIDP